MNSTNNPTSSTANSRSRRSLIALLILVFVLTFLLGTQGFNTYLFKERRLIAAGNEVAVAIKQYKDSSPGASRDYPTALADVMRDPRMLVDTGYLNALPVDPVTEKMEWGRG